MKYTITEKMLWELEETLRDEERSEATIEKYLCDVRQFQDWLKDRPLNRENVAAWKGALLSQGRAAGTVNGKLSALNALFRIIHREDCRVRFLKVQQRVFRDAERELTRVEFLRLVDAARNSGKLRLALILETICACGIRVSELRHITVNALKKGRAEVQMKGKLRIILIPKKLRQKLERYIRSEGIKNGSIFMTRTGSPISRRQIWGEMKTLCIAAGVAQSKVFPHNLRHLFATEFYRSTRDIVKLADMLGHSSIETTRVYLIETGEEHQRKLDRLRLVC